MQTGIILPPPGVKSPRRRRREEGRCEEDPSLTLTLSFSTHSFLTWLAGWLASPSSYPNYHHCCAGQVVSMSQRVLLLFNHQALSSDKSLCPPRTLRRAREPRILPGILSNPVTSRCLSRAYPDHHCEIGDSHQPPTARRQGNRCTHRKSKEGPTIRNS